jgi:hypothetical protein
MDRVRGVIMLLAGCFALWEGWHFQRGPRVFMAVGLGLLALSLGCWHLSRKPPQRLR